MSRTFTLVRNTDVSGISGTGDVAFGVEFPDGQVVMRWNTSTATTSIFANIQDVDTIHGHEGSSVIVWDDERDNSLDIGKTVVVQNTGQNTLDGLRGKIIKVEGNDAFMSREFLVDTVGLNMNNPLWFSREEIRLA